MRREPKAPRSGTSHGSRSTSPRSHTNPRRSPNRRLPSRPFTRTERRGWRSAVSFRAVSRRIRTAGAALAVALSIGVAEAAPAGRMDVDGYVLSVEGGDVIIDIG